MSKQYGGKVKAAEIKEFMSETIHPYFFQFINELGHRSIVDCIDKDYFTEIKRLPPLESPRFEIWVGELGYAQMPIPLIRYK